MQKTLTCFLLIATFLIFSVKCNFNEYFIDPPLGKFITPYRDAPCSSFHQGKRDKTINLPLGEIPKVVL